MVMKTSLECISCFIRQSLEAARFVSDDPTFHEDILRRVLEAAAKIDLMQSPAAVGQWIHRQLRKMTGQNDPYHDIKELFNQIALMLLPELLAKAGVSPDPFAAAVRLAIAGNMIDLGPENVLAPENVRETLLRAFSEPLYGDLEGLRQAAAAAKHILYLSDNAGEIILDRVLIERLPRERTTLAVRGHPVINDATIEDAKTGGLHRLVTVIDNGSDAPGTILDDCSAEFCRLFRKADLVIAKGQGNYETLSDEPKEMFFLLKVKCTVIASRVGLGIGTHAILPSGF
jgi:damage-control phosphatase, subfamily I